MVSQGRKKRTGGGERNKEDSWKPRKKGIKEVRRMESSEKREEENEILKMMGSPMGEASDGK